MQRHDVWHLVCSCSLWLAHYRCLPNGTMGWLNTQWGRPIIARWGSPNQIHMALEEIGNCNQNLEKIDQVVNHVFELKPNHEMMQIQWMLNAPFKQMVEKVWWCKCFRLESYGCELFLNTLFKRRKTYSSWVVGGHKLFLIIIERGGCLNWCKSKPSTRKDVG